jgi:hypothetical protein
MRYRVVSEWGPLKNFLLVEAGFERKVNEALAKDWVLQGGVSVSQSGSSSSSVIIFTQALVADDEDAGPQ